MTHVLPDQSPRKGELRKRRGAANQGTSQDPQVQPRRTEVQGNYERWRAGWVRALTCHLSEAPTRYRPLCVEQWGTHKVARIENKATGGVVGVYRRNKRFCFFSTDQPVIDATLRKYAKRLLDAETA